MPGLVTLGNGTLQRKGAEAVIVRRHRSAYTRVITSELGVYVYSIMELFQEDSRLVLKVPAFESRASCGLVTFIEAASSTYSRFLYPGILISGSTRVQVLRRHKP